MIQTTLIEDPITKIIAFGGHPMSNLKYLITDNGIIYLDGNYALKALENAFGSLQNVIGKMIQYSVDYFGILEGFTPLEV